MNIFDPHITGSLSVSASAEIQGDLTVQGTIYGTAQIDGSVDNAISASHAASYLLTSSFNDYKNTAATTGSNIFIGDQTISGSLLPQGTLTHDLGSDTKRWNDIYLAGSTIDLGGTKITKNSDGDVQLHDSGNTLKRLIASEIELGHGSNKKVLKVNNGRLKLMATNDSDEELAQLSGSFTGSFRGDGSGLINVPASGVTGLSLDRIASTTATASISSDSLITNVSIIPSITNTIDLGAPDKEWRDLYLSSGSLYINGQQVLSTTGTELRVTTDSGESIKILETGSDTITLQTVDGDITLSSSGTGNIELDAPIQITAGNKIISSDGNSIVFGNGLIITGSIGLTGTVDGVDVASLKTDVDAILDSSEADKDSFAEIVGLINSVDTANDQAFAAHYTASNNRLSSLETTSGSHDGRLSSLETTSGSHSSKLNSLELASGSIIERLGEIEFITGSHDGRLDELETFTGSVDGTMRSDFNTYTSSNDSTNTTQNSRLGSLETKSGSLNTDIKSKLNTENVVSGSEFVLNSTSPITQYVDVTVTASGGAYYIDGVEQQIVSLAKGLVYRFDVSDSSNSGHPFRFSTTNNNQYTDGVTVNGTEGSSGAYVQIIVNQDTPQTLLYYCTNHNGMGNKVFVGGAGDTDSITEGSTNLYYTDDRVKSKLNTETVISGSEQVDITNTTNYNLVTNRIGSLESFTASIDDTYASDTDVTTLRNDLNTYTSSNDSTNTNQNSRLGSLETKSGSHDGRLDSIESFTSSIDDTYATDTDVTTLRNDLNTYTSSNDSTNTSQNNRLGSLETKTGSLDSDITNLRGDLNTYTSSNETDKQNLSGRVDSLETKTGSLTTDINTLDGRVDSIESFTSSLDDTYATDTDVTNLTNRVDSLETKSGSLETTNTTQNNRLSSLETKTGSLETTNTNQDGRLDSIESFTASIDDTYASDTDVTTLRNDLNTYTSSNNTTNQNQDIRLTSLETESGSVRSDFNTYTSSNDSTNTSQNNRLGSLETTSGSHDGRLDSIETKTGSLDGDITGLDGRLDTIEGGLEFTGSNVTIKGDLLVKGTETRVDSTTVEMGDNIISLNGSGAQNAGIEVRDNTSPDLLSGSLLWDGQNNYWKGGQKGSEERLLDNTDLTTLDSRLDSIEAETGSYLTDYNNEYTTGATFNSGNGVITFRRNDGDSYTVDIDGRFLDTRAQVHSELYSTGGDANDYTEFGIYRNYASNGPISSHNTILHVSQTDGNYGFQLGSSTVANGDGLYFRNFAGTDTITGSTWLQIATRDWVDDQNFLTDYNDEYTTGATFNTSDGVITFKRNDGDTFTVDIDGRFLTSYSETDTLDSVTTRGNITTNDITVGNITAGPTLELGGNFTIQGTDGTYYQRIKTIDTSSTSADTFSFDVKLGASANWKSLLILNQNDTATFSGEVIATSFTKSGGTSSQFLKADGSVDSNAYLTQHPPIASPASSNNSGRTYIQDILLDGNGHVTGLTTATETVVNTDTNDIDYVSSATFNTGTGVITGTGVGNAGFTVDIDGRYVELGGGTMTGGLITTNLQVHGGSSQIVLKDTTDDDDHSILFRNNADGDDYKITTKDFTSAATGDGFYLGSTGGDNVALVTNNTTALNIDTSQNSVFSGNVTASSFIKSGGTSSQFLKADGSVDSNTYLTQHPNISAASSSNNSGRTYIQDILLDSNGHVTGLTTATETVTDSGNDNDIDYISSATFNTGTGVITGVGVGNATFTVDIDGRFVKLGGDTMTGTLTVPTIQLGSTSFSRSGDQNHVHFVGTALIPNTTTTSSNSNMGTSTYRWKGVYGGIGDFSGTVTASGGNSGNWNTAYGWGDHANENYLKQHPNVNAASSSNNSGRTYIQDILLDGNGHVTGITTSSETVVNTDEYTTGSTFNSGTGIITFTRNDGDTYTVDISATLSEVTVTGGTYNESSQTLTLTKSDGNTVDITGFALDTDVNYYLTGATFNSSNGVITYKVKGSSDVTVDIDGRYLPLSGGTISSSNTHTLKLENSSNGLGTGIEFSDNPGTGTQRGYITHYHGDGSSYGSGASIVLSTNQSTMTILADGKLMYKEGIYSKPATGTGAGTRKDQNWDTAYGWGDHSTVGYLTGFTETYTEHENISASSSSNNSGRTYIQDILVDSNGHITGITTATETVTNTDTNDIDYINAATFNTGTGVITGTGVGNAGFTVDIDGRYLKLGGGTLTGDVTSNSVITADILRLTNDATDTNRHRISVYDSGDTSYGMMLWNTNGTSGEWSTMIYGPNQNNRRISFGKANSNWGNHAGVDELAWLDLDNGNYFTDGNIYPGGSTTKYVSTGRIDNWNTAYGWGDHSTVGYLTGYTDTNDIDYVNSATFNTGTGVVTLSGVGNAGATVDLDGRYLLDTTDTFTGALTINGDIRGAGQQLILNAGESSSYATGQTNEYVYVNAEQGLEVNSDTGNWQNGGWTNRKTALLRGDLLRLDGEDLTKTNIQNFKTAYGWGDHSTVGYLTGYTDTNDIDYINAATFNTGTGVITGTGVGNAGFTVDIDGRYLQLSGGSLSGNLNMTGSNPMIKFVPTGTNDGAGIRFNYTNNDGVMEFWTSDDYSEPFVWRAYDVGLDGTGNYQEWMKLYQKKLYIDGEELSKTNIQNFKTAYAWGDHSIAGYSEVDYYTTGSTFNSGTGTLEFTRNDGGTYSVSLAAALTDVTVTGGTYNSGNQTLTLTKSNGSTVDVSGFAVDTDVNWYTTSASFNTGNGIITGTHHGGTWTVDIDGRYLTEHPNITAASSSNNSGRTYIQDVLLDGNGHVTGITTATETVVNTNDIDYINSATFNTGNGVITGTGVGSAGFSVDIDGRYLQLGGGTMSGAINMNGNGINMVNGSISNVNHITIADPGPTEGIEWLGGNGFRIVESPNDLTTNSGGNLQFVKSSTRILTLGSNGQSEFTDKLTLTSSTSGSTIFDIQGTSGQLFSITDDLTGDLFAVSDSSGVPILNVNANGAVTLDPLGSLYVGNNKVINGSGNIEFDGPVTTSNQDRGIYWTGYDKEGTTDFSDTAHILHTSNSGGLSGSVIEIKSQNDATDGVNFVVNGNSAVRINGNIVVHAGNYTSYQQHPTITAASSSDNSGRTYIQDILLDGNGHVTGVTTATETVTDSGNDIDYITGATFDDTTGVITGTGVGNAGFTVDIDGRYLTTETYTAHDNITAATSSNNSGRTYVQDILVDGNGHVTGITTATETVTDSGNDNYYVDGLSFDTGTGVLTASVNGATNQTVDLDGRYAYSSHDHDRITENSTITFGAAQLQWMDQSGNGGTGMNGAAPQNPNSDWHYQMIMNHANSNGYYVQMAFDFHDDQVWFQRMENGSLQGWREFIHSGNIGSQSVNYATTAGSADMIDGVAFRNTNSGAGIDADSLNSAGITYYTGGVTNFSGNATDGALYSQVYSSSWQHQIAGDYRSGRIAVRGKNNNTWQSWKKIPAVNVSTFSNVGTVTFTHGLGTDNVIVQVYDSNGDLFFPSAINSLNGVVVVKFETNRSGRVVVTG